MKDARKEGSPSSSDLPAKEQLFLSAVSEGRKKGVAGDVNSIMQGMHMSNSSGKEGANLTGLVEASKNVEQAVKQRGETVI
jgi:hypothetical protein